MWWIVGIVFLGWIWSTPDVRARQLWRVHPPIVIDSAVVLDVACAAVTAGLSIPDTLRALDTALDIADPAHDGALRSQQRGQRGEIKVPAKNSGLRAHMQCMGRRTRRHGAGNTTTTLTEVANLLVMGAEWEEAWHASPQRFRRLSEALRAAWIDGAAPVPLLERAAHSVRLSRQRHAKEAAAHLGARLVMPLGLCFLPAFLLLGIVPVVVSAAQALL